MLPHWVPCIIKKSLCCAEVERVTNNYTVSLGVDMGGWSISGKTVMLERKKTFDGNFRFGVAATAISTPLGWKPLD